jgi:hypothetical protein
MPLKTTVGLCKKIGQADYGSLGASCHVEFNLDNSLVQHDLAAFHQHVRDAFVACSQAVNDELARQLEPAITAKPVPTKPGSNGHNNYSQSATTPAAGESDKQLAYLRQLASQTPNVGTRKLEDLAQHVCGKPSVGLSSSEASRLIDTLKAVKSGELHLHDLLTGVTL